MGAPNGAMRAGKLRHRIAVQEVTETRDTHGGVTRTWVTQGTRWGAVEPLSGREALIAKQVDARLSHRVTLRWYEGLTAKFRLQHDGRTLNIIAVKDLDERRREHEVMCSEDA